MSFPTVQYRTRVILWILLPFCCSKVHCDTPRLEDLLRSLGSSATTRITSNMTSIDWKKNQVVFTGQVVVDDGGVKLECDKLTASVTWDEKTGISEVECFGNIRISRASDDKAGRTQKTMIQADSATYSREEDEIVLKGKPKLKVLLSDGTVIEVETIRMDRRNNVIKLISKSKTRIKLNKAIRPKSNTIDQLWQGMQQSR